MIWAALGFVLGFVACAHAPEPLRLWAKRVTGNGQAKVTPLADNIPIKRAPSLGEAASNIAKFFAGCASFFVRHPVLCIGIGVVAAYLLIVGPRLPFGWGQSADDLRAEIAEAEVDHVETERDVAVYAGQRGDETQRRERVIETVVAQGKQDIEDAASTQDFDRLYSAYRIAYDRSLRPDAGSDARDDDPPARRPPLVRQPSSDRA